MIQRHTSIARPAVFSLITVIFVAGLLMASAPLLMQKSLQTTGAPSSWKDRLKDQIAREDKMEGRRRPGGPGQGGDAEVDGRGRKGGRMSMRPMPPEMGRFGDMSMTQQMDRSYFLGPRRQRKRDEPAAIVRPAFRSRSMMFRRSTWRSR